MQGYLLDQTTADSLQKLLKAKSTGQTVTINYNELSGVAGIDGFVGKVIAAPSGRSEYTDCRYYVQPQLPNNSDKDLEAKPTFTDAPNPPLSTFLTATNLAEYKNNTHQLSADELVYCIRLITLPAVVNGYQQPGYRLYVFERTPSGTCNGASLSIGSASTDVAADSTSITDIEQSSNVSYTHQTHTAYDSALHRFIAYFRTDVYVCGRLHEIGPEIPVTIVDLTPCDEG
jgi:hypothetical protein